METEWFSDLLLLDHRNTSARIKRERHVAFKLSRWDVICTPRRRLQVPVVVVRIVGWPAQRCCIHACEWWRKSRCDARVACGCSSQSDPRALRAVATRPVTAPSRRRTAPSLPLSAHACMAMRMRHPWRLTAALLFRWCFAVSPLCDVWSVCVIMSGQCLCHADATTLSERCSQCIHWSGWRRGRTNRARAQTWTRARAVWRARTHTACACTHACTGASLNEQRRAHGDPDETRDVTAGSANRQPFRSRYHWDQHNTTTIDQRSALDPTHAHTTQRRRRWQ